MELLEAKNAALSYIKPASRETLKWFRSKLKVENKADQSPVTIADKNTEEILRRSISHDFPCHGFIGEEYGNEAETSEWVWTIDPIDGTRSFIRGLPFYAILLSLLHKKKPVMGVVCFPALGETFWAVKGHGAWSADQRLAVSKENKIANSLTATADYYCFQQRKRLGLYRKLQKKAGLLRSYPDAFGHMMAVCGRVDVMVDPWASIWDFAPFQILVQEAGGSFANFSGNRSRIDEGSAIVGNKQLVRIVREMIKEEKYQS